MVANRPTIKPCRRTQSPVMRDSNVATIRPHAVNITKYGTNRPVTTHAAAKVLKNMARNLTRSLSAALPMVPSPSRSHRRIYIQSTWSLLQLRDSLGLFPEFLQTDISTRVYDRLRCTAARQDGRLYGARIVMAWLLIKLGRSDEARVALAEARRIRPALTLDRIRPFFGRRVAVDLEAIWD